MEIIELERWERSKNNPRKLEYIGQSQHFHIHLLLLMIALLAVDHLVLRILFIKRA